MRYLARLAAMILVLALGGAALASDPAINSNKGLGVHGRDLVAYQTEKRALRGTPGYSVVHGGVRYLFVNRTNMEAFEKEPERYLPAYGGFCAYGVAQDYKVDVDPEAFTIVDGRLYLNYSRSVRTSWEKDIPGYVRKADANWPALAPKK